MIDSNTTQILINNSDKIYPYFLALIIGLLIALFLFRDRIFQKYAKEYFNEEISKELRNYKKEFFNLLKNQKLANNFKKNPILILNDKDQILQDSAFMANYTHQIPADLEKPIKDLHKYNFILLYIPNKIDKSSPDELYEKYVEQFLSKLDKEEAIVFIYHEDRLKNLKKEDIPKHHVVVNSKLTLVERLENAYIIEKIINY